MWREVTTSDEWNAVNKGFAHHSFLQSWEWGVFQKAAGHRVVRLASDEGATVQAIAHMLPLGMSYWYIPHAPYVKKKIDKPQANALLAHFKKEHALFLRTDPQNNFFEEAIEGAIACRTVPSVQPRCNMRIDVRNNDEAALLSQMHSKTRYNISYAQRKGVAVKEGSIEHFIQLNHETTTRDQFIAHPDLYYQKMNELLSRNTGTAHLKIWESRYQNKVLASALVVYYKNTATYVHGASSNEHRNVMAPHALHWHIMRQAKEAGYWWYDVGGANPRDRAHPAHKQSWEGITRFKEGFGAKRTCNPHSFDLIYRPYWYTLYRRLSALRRAVSP